MISKIVSTEIKEQKEIWEMCTVCRKIQIPGNGWEEYAPPEGTRSIQFTKCPECKKIEDVLKDLD